MSPKRLIIIVALLAALATALVGFAAGGSNGNDQQRPKGTSSGPISSSPRQNPEATKKYWTPERMKHARPPRMSIPGGSKNSGPDRPGQSGSASPPSDR